MKRTRRSFDGWTKQTGIVEFSSVASPGADRSFTQVKVALLWQVMKNQDQDRVVVLGGIEYDIVFAPEIDDKQRFELDLPPRGTRCTCAVCLCENDADAGSVEHPMCGCCLADCPDVHPAR